MAWARGLVPSLGGLRELKAWLERSLSELEAELLRTNNVNIEGDVVIVTCTGTPEGAITAPVGSLALRSDGGAGTTLYVKESGTGNTGWIAK